MTETARGQDDGGKPRLYSRSPLAETNAELAAEWDVEANAELTPWAVLAGSAHKAAWVCELGHTWRAAIVNRSRGTGCPVCAGRIVWAGFNDLATVRPHLAVEWDQEANGEITPQTVGKNSRFRASWRCQLGHRWTAEVRGRSQGNGCPFCSGNAALAGFNDLATLRPELAAQWDEGCNGELTPRDVTASSGRLVGWRCGLDHRWRASISNRAKGWGCPFCSGQAVLPGFNDLATVRPEIADEWAVQANGEFTAQQVTCNSHRRATWRCEQDHSWVAPIKERSRGGGCPTCSGRAVLAGFNDLATVRPEIAAEWDEEANGDLTPQQVTVGSDRRIGWRCRLDHKWVTPVSQRSKGSGCPVCSGRTALAGYNDLATRRPEIAAEWDHEANGDLTPQQVVAGTDRRVGWRCRLDHKWVAPVTERSRGAASCPECATANSSRTERALASLAATLYADAANGVRLKLRWGRRRTSMSLDVAVTHHGRHIAIEYDGAYWHASAVRSLRDEQKTEALLDAGWIVIRIRENDLPHLDIVHPDLFQITHRYRQGTDEQLREQLGPVMAEIVRWLDGRVPRIGGGLGP